MKILHSYCLNYNLGDYALGIGVKNLLRQHLDVDFIGNTNIQGREFNKYYINEVVNKRYDLLVLGGGGVIHGAHWPNGWFWLIDQELIKTIKIPFILYGVGNNYFEGENIPERAVDHLRETKKYARFFSVRNDGSYERVAPDIGADIAEVPDPGFHVGLNSDYARPMKQPYVIMQVANDKADQRFRSDKQAFITGMRTMTKELVKQKYHVVFAPHVFDDLALSKEIADGIDNTQIWDFGYLAFDHADKAVAYYKHAAFVIAMRGHGQILPIGFNVPTIALSNHPKHEGLMKKLDLGQYVVSIDGPNFSKDLSRVVQMLQENHASLVQKYERINANLMRQTNDAFAEIKRKISDPA